MRKANRPCAHSQAGGHRGGEGPAGQGAWRTHDGGSSGETGSRKECRWPLRGPSTRGSGEEAQPRKLQLLLSAPPGFPVWTLPQGGGAGR